MKRNILTFLILSVIALATVLLLRPSAAVRFEGELAMLEPEDALARLDDAAALQKLENNMLLLHANLATDGGELEVARNALNALQEANQPSADVQVALAEVARLQGDVQEAAARMAEAYRLEPTAMRRQTLVGWYRLLRRPDLEIALLRTVPATALSAWEAERLVQLLRQSGRYDDLEALYALIANGHEPNADIFRDRLLKFQIEDGRVQEAMQSALLWFERDAFDQRSMKIAVPALIDRGAVGQATALAKVSLANAPSTAYQLIGLFARSGHRGIAFDLQDQWLDTNSPMTDDAWQTLIDLSGSTGDMRGLRRALGQVARKDIPDELLDRVLRQFLRYRGARALEPYRSYLTPSFLAKAPLIGAAWMASQRRDRETLGYLQAAANLPMGAWDRDIWVSVAQSLNGTAGQGELLQTRDGSGLAIRLTQSFIGDPTQQPSVQQSPGIAD